MLSLPSSSSSSSSSSSYVSPKKYDVFLSFRGEDTRNNFTDHLYAALKRSGIITFRDDPKLEAGEAIRPELFKAIQESYSSVIVFSETYASSGWCLDELAEIVKQKNEGGGHKIFPVFYDVDPSDLRKQKGIVAAAFAQHEQRYKENKDKIESWRSALTQVADVKGWHLKHDRPEAEFIEEVIQSISAVLLPLRQIYSSIPDELIGIKSRLEELLFEIGIGEDDIRIIGICGMGGIGKTTLARVVYNQMSPHFEAKSFLSDVREVSDKSGLAFVQKQLLSQIFPEQGFNFHDVAEGSFMINRMLSQRKVLIVIDDVDNIQHLKWLVGRRDWFGSGSRIIITTRDEHVLLSHRVDHVYKPSQLDAIEALRLFSLKAFNRDAPEAEFMELSKCVLKYAGGLPLALEVLGSFFCGRSEAQWKDAIERLKREPEQGIHERLRISFDGLKETEQKIFLDIACFFKGEEKDLVVKILDGCKYYAEIGIDVLVKKSLVKVYERENSNGDYKLHLEMHDLVQEMGRKIVEQKSVDEPGKRSRLWDESDVFEVLTKNTAMEAIEGMHIDIRWKQDKMSSWNADAFLKMRKLRLLRVFNLPNTHDLKYLSDELRLLHWNHYPLRSLPSSFQPDNLVALLLQHSRIEQLWKGKLHLEKLKLVNLKGCKNLIKTPDFTMAPNLESLNLEGCTKIVDVHPSIGMLRKLKLLNLRDCKRLRSLPTKIGMQSLEILILSGCSNLERLLEEIDGEMECLVKLYLDGTGIRHLPSLIGNLSGLILLDLEDCKNLASLPSSISGLKCLKTLNLSGCSKVEKLPESLQQVESLEELDLSGTAMIKPPSFIFEFKNPKCLSFRGCKGITPSIFQPNQPSVFKGLTSLTEIDLSYCNLRDLPNDICCLSSLERLRLYGSKIISLPANLDQLSNLTLLGLYNCRELKSLPELLRSTSVQMYGYSSVFANATLHGPVEASSTLCLINCHKLAENTNFIMTMLKKHLKAYANYAAESVIFLPGSEIPEWFNHKKDGYSIKIPLPRNDSQWIGVAFCCVFVNLGPFHGKAFIHSRNRNSREISSIPLLVMMSDGIGSIKKDHLYLRYWSRNKLYPKSSEEKCGGETGDGVPDELEVEIQLWGKDWGKDEESKKVKKIGIRIVYEKDLEEMEQLQICNATVEDHNPHNADETETETARGNESDRDPNPGSPEQAMVGQKRKRREKNCH